MERMRALKPRDLALTPASQAMSLEGWFTPLSKERKGTPGALASGCVTWLTLTLALIWACGPWFQPRISEKRREVLLKRAVEGGSLLQEGKNAVTWGSQEASELTGR